MTCASIHLVLSVVRAGKHVLISRGSKCISKTHSSSTKSKADIECVVRWRSTLALMRRQEQVQILRIRLQLSLSVYNLENLELPLIFKALKKVGEIVRIRQVGKNGRRGQGSDMWQSGSVHVRWMVFVLSGSSSRGIATRHKPPPGLPN